MSAQELSRRRCQRGAGALYAESGRGAAQGEVEQISLMKPKGLDKNDTGLLEYLEDIVGTDQYVESIEEKAKK